MKKRVCVWILAMMLVLSLTGASGLKADVHGTLFGGHPEDSITVDVSFDPAWMTDGDNTVCHRELATFASLLSADVYFRDKDLAKGTANRVLAEGAENEYDHTDLLRRLGFSETRYVESFREKEYASDSDDSVTMVMGHTRTETSDVYVVAFRGCFSVNEWNSMFDVGNPSEANTAHPEWIHPERMKGIAIAAERAKAFIAEFIAACDDPSLPDCILYTGHSRGAAIAGFVGADAEMAGDAKVFTYTFNTPMTQFCTAPETKTVFNITGADDFYANPMPFGQETLSHYGTDVIADIGPGTEAFRQIAELRGREEATSVSTDVLAKYIKLFGERFPNRNGLYEAVTVTRRFATEEEAKAGAAEIYSMISAAEGLGLEALCSVSEPAAEGDGFSFTFTYNGAALLHAYSMELAYGAPVYDVFIRLFAEDAAACDIATLLNGEYACLSDGHHIINDYVLCLQLPD